MSVKTKGTFVLLFVLFATSLLLGCDDVTIDSVVEGEKQNWKDITGSVTGDGSSPKTNVWGKDTAKAVCVATGGQWAASIGACKRD